MSIKHVQPDQNGILEELSRLQQRVAELEAQLARQEAFVEPDFNPRLLRQALQNMSVMMLAFNESLTDMVFWNAECERVTGYSAIEIIDNRDVVSLLYPDPEYVAKLSEMWRQLGDNYRGLEWEITCKDGSQKRISWSNVSDLFPVAGWGTWAIGIDVTAQRKAEAELQRAYAEMEQRVLDRTADLQQSNERLELEIQERRKAENALRQSEERLRNVLANMPAMMLAYDNEADTILVWNNECERVTGYSADEIVGVPGKIVNKLLYPDRSYLRNIWREMEERGDDYRDWEIEWRCKDGSIKTIAWSNIAAKFPIPGWATWAIGVDITERKKAAQRALDLAVEQERVKVLEQFIGDASHDLKTPLTSIMFSHNVLKKTTDPEKQRRHLDIMETQVRHLDRVLEDLLNIVRLEKESDLTRTTFDLVSVVMSVVGEHDPIAREKSQTVHFDRPQTPILIEGDKVQVNRLLSNILLNAIMYTPNGGEITVYVKAHDSWAVAGVQDTGIGIRENDLPYIFTRFYRADPARNAHRGGMGLGLAIAKKIAEAHGGRIEVTSQAGQGSTFSVFLPLRQRAAY